MQLSETVKLYMTKEQKALVVMAMNEYINTVNSLVCVAVNGVSISKYTTADVNAYLPSALTNQCIRDAKSIISKYNKECHKVSVKNKKLTKQKSAGIVKKPKIPILKRPCCYINNQNFKIKNARIEFPVLINGKSKRISIRSSITDKQKAIFVNSRLGTMRIVYKGNKIVAQIVYEVLTLVSSALRYPIFLMVVLSSTAMVEIINICADTINICAGSFKKQST